MISGGNIFYDFFQFLMRPFAPRQPSHKVSVSSLGHDGIRPPNRYGRYNNFDDGARRPRKIPNHHKFRKGKNVIEIKKKKKVTLLSPMTNLFRYLPITCKIFQQPAHQMVA